MANIYDLSDTWNDGATTFTSIKMDVTDTASAAASALLDLQVASTSVFKVAKAGGLVMSTDTYITRKAAIVYGGGFYKRLAEVTLVADPNNRNRILTAFPEIAQIYGPQTHFHKQLKHS